MAYSLKELYYKLHNQEQALASLKEEQDALSRKITEASQAVAETEDLIQTVLEDQQISPQLSVVTDPDDLPRTTQLRKGTQQHTAVTRIHEGTPGQYTRKTIKATGIRGGTISTLVGRGYITEDEHGHLHFKSWTGLSASDYKSIQPKRTNKQYVVDEIIRFMLLQDGLVDANTIQDTVSKTCGTTISYIRDTRRELHHAGVLTLEGRGGWKITPGVTSYTVKAITPDDASTEAA